MTTTAPAHATVVKLWATGAGACALMSDDKLSCKPDMPQIAGLNLLEIAFPCVVLRDQTARCWGANDVGQVGDGTNISATQPVPVSGLGNVSQIVAGSYHRCALLNDGTIKCWGDGDFGQLGNGKLYVQSSTPLPVSGVAGAIQLAAGAQHTCALLSNKTLMCWGHNSGLQIMAASTNIPTPVVQSGLSPVNQVVALTFATCALETTMSVACWGVIVTGGPRDFRRIPTLNSIVQIAAGGSHVCALAKEGTVYCWGDNASNQLGDSPLKSSEDAVQVANLSDVTRIHGSGTHTCAQLKDNSVKCWGGQYGASPTLVFDP